MIQLVDLGGASGEGTCNDRKGGWLSGGSLVGARV